MHFWNHGDASFRVACLTCYDTSGLFQQVVRSLKEILVSNSKALRSDVWIRLLHGPWQNSMHSGKGTFAKGGGRRSVGPQDNPLQNQRTFQIWATILSKGPILRVKKINNKIQKVGSGEPIWLKGTQWLPNLTRAALGRGGGNIFVYVREN